jgi:hypothetical protein
VAEVAGRSAGAATQGAVTDDPAADARRHLDEHQVVDRREAQEALAERHHVDVVVDDDVDAAQHRAHAAAHVEAVPAGHDRRARRPPCGELDRPGQADADRHDVAETPPGAAHQRPAAVDDP